MDIVNAYFGNLVFLKVENKENFTVYAAAISSSFGDGKKQYAIAFVPTHMAILDRAYLRDLHWQNFQTRIVTNGYKLPPQRWDIPKNLPTPMFQAISRTNIQTKYLPEDGSDLELILLHDPKKKSQFQYHNTMNLVAALATFRCSITCSSPEPRSDYRPATVDKTLISTGIRETGTTPTDAAVYQAVSYTPVEAPSQYRTMDLSFSMDAPRVSTKKELPKPVMIGRSSASASRGEDFDPSFELL